MRPALVFIASCLFGTLIIEIRARVLNLAPDTVCAKCRAEQSNSDNQKQNNVHRSSPLTGSNYFARRQSRSLELGT